jgi:hypothetical protein
MPEQIVQDSFNEGWIASSSEQADFGRASTGLLRMDNVTLDEKGSVRIANRSGAEGSITAAINSIFSAYVNNRKLRYLYDALGNLYRNYGAAVSKTVYDLLIGSGGTTLKCAFINALGHTIALAGALQFKDRGDIQWPLTIPQPAVPILSNGSGTDISLQNLDGSGDYTNWASVESSAFDSSGTTITFTPSLTTNRAIVQTVFSALVDTTDFGFGTGFDTPQDLIAFNFECDDPNQLSYFKIELICTDPSTGITDEYWAELDYSNFFTNTNPNNPYVPSTPFTISPGLPMGIEINRGSFIRVGSNTALSMATIKAVRFTVGVFTATNFGFDTQIVRSGAINSAQSYVAVELNDTGQFVQYSIASAEADISGSPNFIQVSRASACNAQCNEIRVYRNNLVLGQFIEIHRESGAYGFTPTTFLDTLTDDAALAAAAIDSDKILNFYRTQLPTDIIGAIYFASRVVYLTSSSFFPSFQLDLGSYDSRFTYELTGTNSEQCLFIVKLSVGTFIVATTVDFYQVSGTFALTSITNPDGTVITTQDVNVLPLGISDPAVSSSFIELEGSILYMSAIGLRSLANGSSTLLNTSVDLLFRNETRYGIPPVSLGVPGTNLVGMASSGNRIYIALPFSDGLRRIMVSTFNAPDPAELRGGSYWRLLTESTLCLNREQDGTVICGDSDGTVTSLEGSFTGSLPVYFETQYVYGQQPASAKTLGSLLIFIDTGNTALNLTVNGLTETGAVLSYTTTITSNGLTVVAVDPHDTLVDCIAFQLVLSGTVPYFELGYIIYEIIQDYPPLTFYQLIPFTNFGKDTLKKLAKWGFMVNPLGHVVTAKVTADGAVVVSDVLTPNPQGIQTMFWNNVADLAALDWQLEVTCSGGMRFFKFMNPDILQVYPPGRVLDQAGPFDLDREGIVFALRLRVIATVSPIHYKIYDNDSLAYEDNVTTTLNVDTTYEIPVPKGINTSVLRVLFTATGTFYRFYLELKVRTLGKETEEGTRWIEAKTA